jgi:hypothetical protein
VAKFVLIPIRSPEFVLIPIRIFMLCSDFNRNVPEFVPFFQLECSMVYSFVLCKQSLVDKLNGKIYLDI